MPALARLQATAETRGALVQKAPSCMIGVFPSITIQALPAAFPLSAPTSRQPLQHNRRRQLILQVTLVLRPRNNCQLNSVNFLPYANSSKVSSGGFFPARSSNGAGLLAGIRPTFDIWDRWVTQLCWEPRHYE